MSLYGIIAGICDLDLDERIQALDTSYLFNKWQSYEKVMKLHEKATQLPTHAEFTN